LEVRLFERNGGILTATDAGKIVIFRAERVEIYIDAINDTTLQRLPGEKLGQPAMHRIQAQRPSRIWPS
jgi:hypothetical protein